MSNHDHHNHDHHNHKKEEKGSCCSQHGQAQPVKEEASPYIDRSAMASQAPTARATRLPARA
jgi:hypothetical protein